MPKLPKGKKEDFPFPDQGRVMVPHIADCLARRFGDMSHPVDWQVQKDYWTLETSSGARRSKAFIAAHLRAVDARAAQWQKAGVVPSLPSVAEWYCLFRIRLSRQEASGIGRM
jgi:hypothetical protein